MGNKENWRQNFHTWNLPTKDLEVRMATLSPVLGILNQENRSPSRRRQPRSAESPAEGVESARGKMPERQNSGRGENVPRKK